SIASTATIFILVLVALFAERRRSEADLKRSEAELKQSNNRLQLALDCAELGTWSLHLNTGCFDNDVRDRRIHGLAQLPQSLAQMRSQVHPDDLPKLDGAFKELRHVGSSCRTEYRLAPRTDQERARRERWVAMEGTVVRRANGCCEQLLGVTRDITKRKHAELQLTERNTQLELAALAALVGSYVYDVNKGTMQVSQGYPAIHGLPEGMTDTTIGEWRARVHPEDLARAEGLREQAFADRRKEDNAEYRIILSNGEVRWIERRGAISYSEHGRPERVVGVNIDVTERKRAEQALVERNILLALAGRAARVGTFAYDTAEEILQISEDYAAIHGLPEGTAKIARSEWLAGVHPQDVERVELPRSEAFREQRNEYSAEFRIIRPGGEVRWVEIRCFITYDGNGHPKRVVGVSTDVTDRKQAELRLAERNAQFGLAQK